MKKTMVTVAGCALAALALSVGVALGSPAGDLDPSFDGDGRRLLPFAMTPRDVLVQPDGKIVLTDSASFTVVRLSPDGSLDRGFGGDGAAAADFGAGAVIASAALQPDGKLVVAGQTASNEIAVARFNESGLLDATFDPGGPDGDGQRVYGVTELQPHTAPATLVQPDGRIVLAGASATGITASRLTASGAPDGTVFDYAGSDPSDSVNAAALAPDGKIVVAGHSATSGFADFDAVVARFNPDGTLDKSLAGTGRVDLGPPNRNDSAVSVLVQPDGKIVLAAASGTAEKRMVVTRLDVNGAPDTTFAGDGTAAPDFVGQTFAAGGALQPDGKILLAGTTAPGAEFAVARLDASGALDPSFGLDGKTTIPFDDVALAHATALQPDGRFVIAGLTAVENGAAIRTALARVLADQPPASGGPGGGGAPGGDGTPPGASPDTVAPRFLSLRLSPTAFAALSSAPSVRDARARGTTVSYRLSEAATASFRVQRALAGRRVRGRCVRATRANRGRPRCTRYRTLRGRFSHSGTAGLNRFRFSGRLARRKLRPGSHRLVATARDAAGNRSNPVRRRFRIR